MERTRRVKSEPTEPILASNDFNYEEDLKIDPGYLDVEFLNHSELFMKYAKQASVAKRDASFAEEKLKTIRSQIIKRCKESGDKHTETTLEAAYRLDPEYIEAKDELIKANYAADLMGNAVFAIQSRKTALENLVRLYATSYNSGPEEPRDLPQAAKKLQEMKEVKTERIIRERMKG
jgi:hypothetical protein